MEEEEDDIYGTTSVGTAAENYGQADAFSLVKEEGNQDDSPDDDDEDGEEIEEDTDSDIDIITERRPGLVPESLHDPRLQTTKREESRSASVDKSPGKLQSQSQSQSHAQLQPIKTERQAPDTPQKPGYQYPDVHSSDIDVDHIPTYDPVGKPITQVDLDADLIERDKPWRRPGSDQTDYFNYGFDEFTWTMYCLKQQSMRDTITEQKAESNKFEMMFSGIPSMPGMPGTMPITGGSGGAGPGSQQAAQQQQQQQQGGQMGSQAPPGMPEMSPDMMNQMMQQMMASGVDPSQMDFNMFMQQFQAMQPPVMAAGIVQGGGPPGGYGQIMEAGQQNRNNGNFNRGGRQGRRW